MNDHEKTALEKGLLVQRGQAHLALAVTRLAARRARSCSEPAALSESGRTLTGRSVALTSQAPPCVRATDALLHGCEGQGWPKRLPDALRALGLQVD